MGGYLRNVWGNQPGEAFVVGTDRSMMGGYLARFENGQFVDNAYPVSWLCGVWGAGANDAWAAGSGMIYRYDGSWSRWEPE